MSKILMWCGLDVSKPHFDAGLVYDQSFSEFTKVPSARFPRDKNGVKALGHWLTEQIRGSYASPDQIGFVMEATGVYSLELFEIMKNQGWDHISIINPRLAKDFNKSLGLRSKTDRIDSRALGFFGRERKPALHEPQKPEYQHLRVLVRIRRNLIEDKTSISLRLSTIQDKFGAKILKKQIAMFERLVKDCENEIKKHIKAHESLSEDLALMSSMFGIGAVTAWTILGELGDLRCFKTSRGLSSLAGTAPTVYESGSSIRRKTRISKDCGKAVRKVLYMAALAAARYPQSPFHSIYERLIRNGKAKKAALCVIMRKMLVILRAMLLTETHFDPKMVACGKPAENFGKKNQKLPISA